MLAGKPFVGPSGRVFDGALRVADIDRESALVTNVFDTKAPDNDVTEWLRDPDIFGAAIDRLTEEINAAQPTVIVPLGGTALFAFTGTDAITKAAGAPSVASRIAPGKKLLASFHPAFILRDWRHLSTLIAHLIKAKAEADAGPGLNLPAIELTLEPDFAEVRRWVLGGHLGGPPGIGCLDGHHKYFPNLLNADLISLDIETGWGQITCIGLSPDDTHAIVIPLVDLNRPNRRYWPQDEELEVIRLLKRVLESPTPKLLQNGVYDIHWLLEKWGIRVMNYREDTRLMAHAHLPEMPKDLGSLMSTYLTDWPATKTWGAHEEKKDA